MTRRFGTRPDASPPRSALDLLAKNQGHIASGVLQQLLASDTNLGAKLQTLQQVNERTASHPSRGCASQVSRLHLLFETFRENISECRKALRDIRTDLGYSLRPSQRRGRSTKSAASSASLRSVLHGVPIRARIADGVPGDRLAMLKSHKSAAHSRSLPRAFQDETVAMPPSERDGLETRSRQLRHGGDDRE